jgi:peptidyl-prolyl cis-trans isomerase D
MLEFIRSHQKSMQILLMVFIVPSFIALGVEGYSRFKDPQNIIAKVDKSNLTREEFDAQYKDFLKQNQEELGEAYKKEEFDIPQNRRQVLDKMIHGLLMQKETQRLNVKIEDEQLVNYIRNMPGVESAKNKDGNIDAEKFKTLVAAQNMTVEQFQERIKYLLTQQYLSENIAKSALMPTYMQKNIANGLLQRREIQRVDALAQNFESNVVITTPALQAYYKAHSNDFMSKELVDVDYIRINKADLVANVNVNDADIKKYYNDNIAQFKSLEKRRARHILIKVENNNIEQAKNKAKAVLERVKANDKLFAEIAVKESGDAVSASKGGDLDFFDKGIMVKAFDDKVFSMQINQIELAQTDFGFHIIQLTDVKPSITQSLDDAKADIASKLKQNTVNELFAKKINDLTNASLDSNNIDILAKKINAPLNQVTAIARNGSAKQIFTDRKILKALFDKEVLKGMRNTDVIQLEDYALLLKVKKYYPVRKLNFDEAKAEVQVKFIEEESLKLAKKDGAAKLASIKRGGDNTQWSANSSVSRMDAAFPKQMIEAIFNAPVTALPAYVGVSTDLGYSIFKINKIENIEATPNIVAMVKQFSETYAMQELQALLHGMRSKYNAEVVGDIMIDSSNTATSQINE